MILGSKVDDMTELISEANTALMSFVMLLMNLAPVGIFCLVASRFGEAQAKGEFIETFSGDAMKWMQILNRTEDGHLVQAHTGTAKPSVGSLCHQPSAAEGVADLLDLDAGEVCQVLE